MEAKLKSVIRDVPDFPKPGILFRDVTPVLKDPALLREAARAMAAPFRGRGIEIVCAPEARGFVFGTAVALELGAGLVPVRKPGKLPWKTRRHSYELEYGTDTLEIHEDALRPGQKVLLVDDLLATGGTIAACQALVTGLGAKVAGCAFLVELADLGGRSRLGDAPIHVVVRY